MSTHIAIVTSLRNAADAGEPVVLATVVRVVGSSYGGVGARMVIRVDGSTVGLVSGGCLESDLCAHALEVHAAGSARMVTYDTRADDDAVWGLGLGCNGLIDVLLDPLPPQRARALADLLDSALSGEEPSVIATVVQTGTDSPPRVGAQALFAGSRIRTVGDWGDGIALAESRARVADALAAGRRGLVHEANGAIIAFEVVAPAVRLVICGSGPDAAPVARLGTGMGWNVTVVDHRPAGADSSSRFGDAGVVHCSESTALAEAVRLTPRTAVVVMSHHFARDTDYLQALLAADIEYIGVLGPRARLQRMLAELDSRGADAHQSAEAIHGPVGLDLGGDGPEAIALAIIAEVSAVMHDRTPSHLRDRETLLHDPARR